jgi:cation transport protein ChaC
MLSIHHRGSEEEPGLVLALDAVENAQCTGVAFRIPTENEAVVLEALRARELISSAYEERTVTVVTEDGRALDVLAYVINRDHRQYVQYALERQAQMIAVAVGGRGPNPEYLYNTAAKLTEMGIKDPDMDWLVARVEYLTAHV